MRCSNRTTKKRKKDDDDKILASSEEIRLLPIRRPALSINSQLTNPEPVFIIQTPIKKGTYGEVSKGILKETGKLVAIKRIIDSPHEGLSINSVRELVALQALEHPNIVQLYFTTTDSELSSIFLIMEYVENDLHTVLRNIKNPFSEAAIKTILWQLTEAVAYLHANWYMHRDITPANILINNRGCIKLADFGLSRQFGDQQAMLTATVVTLYYRAPELLVLEKENPDEAYLDSDSYGPAVDLWSIGCVFAELISGRVLFLGSSEIDQLRIIVSSLISKRAFVSSINTLKQMSESASTSKLATLVPGLTKSGLDLLFGLLTLDPSQRISALELLDHPFFSHSPYPLDPEMFPTFRSSLT